MGVCKDVEEPVRVCNDVPEEVCDERPHSVTKYVDEEQCSDFDGRECVEATRQECSDVVERVPIQYFETECSTEYNEECTYPSGKWHIWKKRILELDNYYTM